MGIYAPVVGLLQWLITRAVGDLQPGKRCNKFIYAVMKVVWVILDLCSTKKRVGRVEGGLALIWISIS